MTEIKEMSVLNFHENAIDVINLLEKYTPLAIVDEETNEVLAYLLSPEDFKNIGVKNGR